MELIVNITRLRAIICDEKNMVRAYRDGMFAEKCRIIDDMLSVAIRYAICGHYRKALRYYLLSVKLWNTKIPHLPSSPSTHQ